MGGRVRDIGWTGELERERGGDVEGKRKEMSSDLLCRSVEATQSLSHTSVSHISQI